MCKIRGGDAPSVPEWLTQGSIVLLAILMAVHGRDGGSASPSTFCWCRNRAPAAGHRAIASAGSHRARCFVARHHHTPRAPVSASSVISHFRPVSRRRRVAAAGSRLRSSSTWISVWPFDRPPLVLGFFYFTWLLVYVAWAFKVGAKATGGVTHWRMYHAALGAALLAAVFLLAVIIFLVPRGRIIAVPLVPLAGLGAALNYYFAFAPPPWLRRLWQSAELYGLLSTRGDSGRSPSE